MLSLRPPAPLSNLSSVPIHPPFAHIPSNDGPHDICNGSLSNSAVGDFPVFWFTSPQASYVHESLRLQRTHFHAVWSAGKFVASNGLSGD